MLSSQTSVRRHQAFEFFKPVEDDVDLGPSSLSQVVKVCRKDHYKPFTVGFDVIIATITECEESLYWKLAFACEAKSRLIPDANYIENWVGGIRTGPVEQLASVG